jgi:DHA3 family macrolide efflux protein-like MFS transporter
MELPVWVVMVVLFIRSVGSAFHSPALSAVTPLLVPEEELTKCAGYSQSIQSISYITSPAFAAILYSLWDLRLIIGLDIVGAFIACITVAMVTIPRLDVGKQLTNNFIMEIKEGFFTLKDNKGLFSLLLIGTLYMFVYMPINALYPLMSMGYFGGTITHASITEIAYASGMLAGGLLLGMLGKLNKRVAFMTASILFMGLCLTLS